MKLIIDVAEKYYEACKDAVEKSYPSQIEEVIANGTPYNPTGDLISREALKETLQYKSECIDCSDECCTSCFYEIINNASTVKFSLLPADESKEEAYMRGYNHGKAEGILKAHTRPKGEWIIVKDEKYGDNVKCPFCGKELAGTDLNFCCKCGAQMKGGDNT